MRAAIMDLATGELDEVDFDEPLFDAYFSGNPEWHSPFLRMTFTSFVTPSQVLDLEVATGEKHLRKQMVVLGGYDAADYGQRRVWATADDGAQVSADQPVVVVEAMKMETVVSASSAGTFRRGGQEPGAAVVRGEVLGTVE